jgi:hypothetical protein
MDKEAISEIVALAEDDIHALKPGFCRVNFNYFISREEFDFILSAIEQIAQHGWKLLPLYALCLRTVSIGSTVWKRTTTATMLHSIALMLSESLRNCSLKRTIL